MTFSEFANLLFSYIGGNQSREDFVTSLVRNIMKKPTLKSDIKSDENGEYVPLPQTKDSLGRIFNGRRPISAKAARKILSYLDKEHFQLYIDDFPDDTIDLIRSAFQENGIEISDKQIGRTCADLFVSILEDCANKKRQARTVTPQYQPPEAEQSIVQVVKTQMATAETIVLTENEPPLLVGSSDGIDDISLQGRAGIEQKPREINTCEIEKGTETEFEDEAEQQLPDLSKPMFFREYRHLCLKNFEIYAAWNPEPLDPELKEKWESASITDEFFKSIKDYGIEKFMDIIPSDLLPMKKVITGVDVINRVKSAVRFVGYIDLAIDYMLISNENKEIFEAIANFVAFLRKYLDFLRENSNNPDLFSDEFVLIPSGDNELEQKANMYYSELQTLYKHITR